MINVPIHSSKIKILKFDDLMRASFPRWNFPNFPERTVQLSEIARRGPRRKEPLVSADPTTHSHDLTMSPRANDPPYPICIIKKINTPIAGGGGAEKRTFRASVADFLLLSLRRRATGRGLFLVLQQVYAPVVPKLLLCRLPLVAIQF